MEASDYLTSDDATPPTPTSAEGWSLKPCPFCGGAAKLWGEDSTWAKLCRVSCTVCYANTGQYVETRAAAAENWNRRPAVLPTTSVEEARRSVMEAIAEALRMVGLIDVAVESLESSALDEYEASVRAEEREKVRAMVEATPLPRDPTGMGISVDASDYKSNVLAGLAKMEGK